MYIGLIFTTTNICRITHEHTLCSPKMFNSFSRRSSNLNIRPTLSWDRTARTPGRFDRQGQGPSQATHAHINTHKNEHLTDFACPSTHTDISVRHIRLAPQMERKMCIGIKLACTAQRKVRISITPYQHRIASAPHRISTASAPHRTSIASALHEHRMSTASHQHRIATALHQHRIATAPHQHHNVSASASHR